jgi:hypothetical protein
MLFGRRDQARGPAAVAAALEYHRLGWSVIPLEPGALTPLVPWQPLRYRLPTSAEIGDWFGRRPDAAVGVVLGFVSALAVVRVESGAAASPGPLPETVASVGSGGRQLFYGHPGTTLPARGVLAPGIDLIGDGGWVPVPPSEDTPGERLCWEVSPAVRAPVPLPVWVLERARVPRSTDLLALLRAGPDAGDRAGAAAAVAGHLLARGLARAEVLELVHCWNQLHCRPPLDDDALRGIVDGAPAPFPP